MLLFALAAFGATPAAACAPFPAQQEAGRFMALTDFLRLPDGHRADLDDAPVTTVGYLIRLRTTLQEDDSCPGGARRIYRLWLTPVRPVGMKGLRTRHRAIVAVAEMPEGGPKPEGLRRISELVVGRKIKVSGRLSYNPAARKALMGRQGSLWELHALSEAVPCGGGICRRVSK